MFMMPENDKQRGIGRTGYRFDKGDGLNRKYQAQNRLSENRVDSDG